MKKDTTSVIEQNATADKSLKSSEKGAKAGQSAPKVESFDIAKSDQTFDLAKDLARFIKENKLTTQVQGKEFVNVEGATLSLGQVVIFRHELVRVACYNQGQETREWRVLSAGYRHGIIIGKRRLQNGEVHYDEGYHFNPVGEAFTAYLVAFSLHRKPVLVRPRGIIF